MTSWQLEQGVSFSIISAYRIKLLVDIRNFISKEEHYRVVKVSKVPVEGKLIRRFSNSGKQRKQRLGVTFIRTY